jgi:hypothetical protein
MCEDEWSVFQNQILPEANERLTVIFESFCEDGPTDLPESCFRWFAPSHDDPPGVEIGAFEAKGVVLLGRRALINGRDAFFVTKLTVDPQPQPKRGRPPKGTDYRQRDLPFEQTNPGGRE